MSDSAPKESVASGPPPTAEVIVKSPKASPFNAICAILPTLPNGNAFPGSGYVVKTKKGGLAVITAGHVLRDPANKIDATKNPSMLDINAGVYVVEPAPPPPQPLIGAVSPKLKAASCLVHENFDPDGIHPASILHDIGIIFLSPEAVFNGAPMSWAEDKVFPKGPPSQSYSVLGHNYSGDDKLSLARQRFIKIDPMPKQDAAVFLYTSQSAHLGHGQSGGPVLVGWYANPADMKNTVAYGHHCKSSANRETSGPPPTVNLGAMRYTAEIAKWLTSKGL